MTIDKGEFILMGLPGSGKTTYAKTLKKNYGGAYICDVDEMFTKLESRLDKDNDVAENLE